MGELQRIVMEGQTKRKKQKSWHEFMAYVYMGFILTSRLIPAGMNPRNHGG